MSSGNPLGPLADSARTVEQTLRRAIAATDEQWNDSARRSFDTQHLSRIEDGARLMTDGINGMAQRLQTAAHLLTTDG